MRILIMGAGKMGSFFIDLLSFDHEVAVYEKDAKRLRFTYNCYRFTKMEEVEMFRPELVINAVTVKYTIPAFEELLPHLSKDCIISDIASVKTGLQEFPTACSKVWCPCPPRLEQLMVQTPTFTEPVQLKVEFILMVPSSSAAARVMGL